jgi:hypothetical protein
MPTSGFRDVVQRKTLLAGNAHFPEPTAIRERRNERFRGISEKARRSENLSNSTLFRADSRIRRNWVFSGQKSCDSIFLLLKIL